MKKRKIYKLKFFAVISGMILICAGVFSQNPSNVYDEAVKSCAIVTDQSESGIASGFFINNNIFITNRHVTKHIGRSSIVIKTKNGEEFAVKRIIKEYSKSDIAILETEASSKSFLKLSNPEGIKTGEKVFAIGNPTSADFKVYDFNFTEGIINNITFEDINSENLKISAKVIVHSASLNPGNSGGPLINDRGEVIGINAFVKGGMAGNYFFAIHLEELHKALDDNNIPYIISGGDSSKKYITKNTDSTRTRLDTGIVKRDSISFGQDSLSLKTVNVKSDDSYYLIIGLAALGGLALIMIPVMISRRRRPDTMQRQTYIPPPPAVPVKPVQKTLKAYLIAEGKQYSLSPKTIVIGREPGCDIIIHDKNASRQHLQIIFEEPEYVAIDLNSKNGTMINGIKITRKILNDGDKITAGGTTIVFVKA